MTAAGAGAARAGTSASTGGRPPATNGVPRLAWAALALGLPAGLLAGFGLGGVAAVAVPVAVACALGLLGDVPLFLFIVVAVSGVGFHWADSGLTIAGRAINLSGVHWGLILATGVVLLLRRFPRPLPRPLVLYAAFLALAAAALLWTDAAFEGLRQLLLITLPAVVAGVALAYVRRERDVALVLAGYGVALVVAVVVAVAMPLFGAEEAALGLSGGLGARTLAIFLLPVLALALASARHRSPAFLWMVGAVVVLGVATLSRTAVAVMLVLPFLAMAGMRWPARLAVLALAVVLALGVLRIDAFRERFGGRQARVTAPAVQGEGTRAAITVGAMDLSGRGWIWYQTARRGLERPVLGHGTGSATAWLAGLPRSPAAHPHNEYLRVFHDQGGLGLVLILVFGAGTLLHFRRLHRNAASRRVRQLALASYLATAAYAMIAVTDNPLVYSTFFTQNVFVLYALTAVTAAREREGPAGTGTAEPGHAPG